VAPTTDEIRLPLILGNATGFVYFVSITGVTGSAAPNVKLVGEAVARLRRHTKLPVVVGFGVRSADGAAAIAEAADGVAVGSSIVEAIRLSLNGGAATPSTVGAVTGIVETLARGLRAVPK
jgi:tryptophan synthase alpha chain